MRFRGTGLFAIILLTCASQLCAQQPQALSLDGPLTGEQIALKLEEKNRERAQALRNLQGRRTYRLEYQGAPGGKRAEMRVQMFFEAPGSKRFTVLSEEGSRLIIDHVFKKLLESEQEALDDANRRMAALSHENYEFSLAGYEQHPGGDLYVLDVTPRTRNKFLYKGRIWVSAVDFALTRIEAAPAKNPSFWIKRTEISHEYAKVGDFWLPANNRTESVTRWGGHALLTIEYTDYRINSSAAGSRLASTIPVSPAVEDGNFEK